MHTTAQNNTVKQTHTLTSSQYRCSHNHTHIQTHNINYTHKDIYISVIIISNHILTLYSQSWWNKRKKAKRAVTYTATWNIYETYDKYIHKYTHTEHVLILMVDMKWGNKVPLWLQRSNTRTQTFCDKTWSVFIRLRWVQWYWWIHNTQ